jgi:hypothetical protein
VYMTDLFVRSAEEFAVELPVVLLISGKFVGGYVTPRLRYDEWTQQSLLTAGKTGSFSSAINWRGRHESTMNWQGRPQSSGEMEIGPMPEEQAARVKKHWDEELEARRARGEDSSALCFPAFALRDVIIHEGEPADWDRIRFMAVSAASVDAIVPLTR